MFIASFVLVYRWTFKYIPTYIRHCYFHIHIFIHSPFEKVFVYIVIFFGIARLFPCCGKLCIARGILYIRILYFWSLLFSRNIYNWISAQTSTHLVFFISIFLWPFAFCVQKQKKNSIRKWEVKRTPKDKILSHVYWGVILVGENWGHFYCCRHKNKLVHFRAYHCILMRVLDILLVHLVFLSCSALIFHARKDSVYTFILFSFFFDVVAIFH